MCFSAPRSICLFAPVVLWRFRFIVRLFSNKFSIKYNKHSLNQMLPIINRRSGTARATTKSEFKIETFGNKPHRFDLSNCNEFNGQQSVWLLGSYKLRSHFLLHIWTELSDVSIICISKMRKSRKESSHLIWWRNSFNWRNILDKIAVIISRSLYAR